MKHAFIMDPLEQVKAYKDTTYYLMLAAQKRGHEVFKLSQMGLSLRHGQPVASLLPVTVQDDIEYPFIVGDPEVLLLEDMDCVWERTDPPMNRRYFYTSLLLDFLPSRVKVVNRPQAIRDWNEKLAALKFPELTPQTLVSADRGEILKFLDGHGRITLKPIDGHGGKGIQFCTAGQGDVEDKITLATDHGRRWTIAQQYLTEADKGDKRILLLNGDPIGAILRLHAEGEELNNLDAGGSANATDLTARDLEICRSIGPALRDNGIVFAGIDVIGDMMIEVNVTSPTGIQEASRFAKRDLHFEVIDYLAG